MSKILESVCCTAAAVIIGTIAGGGMIQGGEVTSAVPTMPEREGQPIRQVPVTPPTQEWSPEGS